MKKIIALTLITSVLLGILPGCSKKQPVYEILAYQQGDQRWGDYVPEGHNEPLRNTACGMFSVVNSVRFLTGYEIDIRDLADYAARDGSFKSEGGTYRYLAYCENGTIEKYFALHSDIKVRFTKYWGGGACGAAAMKEYLQQGNVCLIHIKGHFMSVAAYDEASDKYLVLDSAANRTRGTSTLGAWIEPSKFEVGQPCGIDDGFCAFEAIGTPKTHRLPPVDNSHIGSSLTLEVYGKGSAYFADVDGNVMVTAPGKEVKIKIRPKLGYRLSAVIINGQYQKITDTGSQTYVIIQPENDSTVQICFIHK